MYLSQLLINVGDDPDRPRPGRLWLRNVYRVHQRLSMGFPSAGKLKSDREFLKPYMSDDFGSVHVQRSNAEAFLFRIDPLPGGRAMVLVQSAVQPDWGYAFSNAVFLLAGPPSGKHFEVSLREGDSYRFRLQANPTRKIETKTGDDGKKSHGKRVPVPNERLEDWLLLRAQRCGFRIREMAVQAGYLNFSKGPDKQGSRLRTARYDGVLEVTDPSCLGESVISGIGPAKAFGCGLLSLAPANGR